MKLHQLHAEFTISEEDLHILRQELSEGRITKALMTLAMLAASLPGVTADKSDIARDLAQNPDKQAMVIQAALEDRGINIGELKNLVNQGDLGSLIKHFEAAGIDREEFEDLKDMGLGGIIDVGGPGFGAGTGFGRENPFEEEPEVFQGGMDQEIPDEEPDERRIDGTYEEPLPYT